MISYCLSIRSDFTDAIPSESFKEAALGAYVAMRDSSEASGVILSAACLDNQANFKFIVSAEDAEDAKRLGFAFVERHFPCQGTGDQILTLISPPEVVTP